MVTPSALRSDLFRLLDRVIRTGRPLVVQRGVHRLEIRLVPAETRGKLDRLTPHPDLCSDPEGVVVSPFDAVVWDASSEP